MKKSLMAAVGAVVALVLAGCGADIRGKDVVVAQKYCAKNDGVLTMRVSSMWNEVRRVTCNDGALYEIQYVDTRFIAGFVGGDAIGPDAKPSRPAKVVSKATQQHARPVPMPPQQGCGCGMVWCECGARSREPAPQQYHQARPMPKG